jgi:hypothetical protein
LKQLQEYNSAHNITLTAANAFQAPGGSGSIMTNMMERLAIQLDHTITDIDLLPIRPVGPYKDVVGGQNVGILLTFDNGSIELWDIFGDLLYRYMPSVAPEFVATTTNHEHSKFVTIGKDRVIRVHDV